MSEENNHTTQTDQLLIPEEAADYLRISTRKIHALCRDGKLEYIEVSPRERRFRYRHHENFLESQTVLKPKSIDKCPPGFIPLCTRRG